MAAHHLVADARRSRRRCRSWSPRQARSETRSAAAGRPSSSRRWTQVLAVDRVDHLVGLLDHVGPQALQRLLAVPGAAVGREQALHDLQRARVASLSALGHRRHLGQASADGKRRAPAPACDTAPRGTRRGHAALRAARPKSRRCARSTRARLGRSPAQRLPVRRVRAGVGKQRAALALAKARLCPADPGQGCGTLLGVHAHRRGQPPGRARVRPARRGQPQPARSRPCAGDPAVRSVRPVRRHRPRS